MARGRTGIEHLLRRAGFGASPADLASFDGKSMSDVVDYLLNFEDQPDDVDTKIGNPAYVSVFNRAGGFQPNSNIEDARQRWLFRMVHYAAAAAGEDGALLAQPLCHRVQQDRWNVRRCAGRQVARPTSPASFPARKVNSRRFARWRLAASPSC
jgi:hypothetical protein